MNRYSRLQSLAYRYRYLSYRYFKMIVQLQKLNFEFELPLITVYTSVTYFKVGMYNLAIVSTKQTFKFA